MPFMQRIKLSIQLYDAIPLERNQKVKLPSAGRAHFTMQFPLIERQLVKRPKKEAFGNLFEKRLGLYAVCSF